MAPRGDVWYVKYRDETGRQIKQRLGRAYTGKGACPPGSYTRKTARAELDARLTDVRRGVARHERTGETFADAAAEWLRWVESRGRKPSTISGYRSMIHRHLDPAFGNSPDRQGHGRPDRGVPRDDRRPVAADAKQARHHDERHLRTGAAPLRAATPTRHRREPDP
jgi:hypothetical protein